MRNLYATVLYTPRLYYKDVVRTITYNYTVSNTDTLEGIAMQKTNFFFVHYVIDDCCTDGEQVLIKTWLNEHCDMDKTEYVDLEPANVIFEEHCMW